METPIQEFAEALKAQREARGLTLDDLFRRTRISPQWLSAIETGRFDILPPIYIRLFLKTYAREVGLDVDEVITHYETIAPATPPPHPPPPKRTTSPVVIIALSLVFIATIALVAWQIHENVPEDPAMPLDMAAPPASFQPQPPVPELTPPGEPPVHTEEIPPASLPPEPQTLPTPSPVPIAQPIPESQTLPIPSPAPIEQPVQEPEPQTAPTASPVLAQPIPEPQALPVPPPAPVVQPVPETAPSGDLQHREELPTETPEPAPHPLSDAPLTPVEIEPAQDRSDSMPPAVASDTSHVLTAYDMPLPADLSDQETITLAGFIRETTHVSVYADGQMVFDGELRTGSQPRWQARDSFRLHILRAGAIAMSLQNQAIVPPSSPDQSLRLLVNRTRIRVEELALPPTDR